MQDTAQQQRNGEALDWAVRTALREAAHGIPAAERAALIEEIRARLEELLATAPIRTGDVVDDMARRACLAASLQAGRSGGA